VKSKDLYPDIFSRHALAYQQRLEEVMARGESRGRTRSIELLEPLPGMRILDLACGPGTLTRVLAPRVEPGGEMVGVDLAAGMIELARASSPANSTFEVMDIENLTYPDASFDAAICGHGLQFVPHLGQALSEARRVLRAGGALAASIPMATANEPVWALIDAVADRRLPPPPAAADASATRATVNDPGALQAAALEAGFATATVESIEEMVVWKSAEQLVSRFMSWWDVTDRVDGLDAESRRCLVDESVAAVRREHPGAITTVGRNLVLFARA
jgi:ubiquinone/menaquinone biosynthesis C-methylase UbiE